MQIDWIEWLGYLASVVILISLTMASIVKLRWINLVGALLYTIYGLLIHSIPVAFLNFGIVLINIYYLYIFYTAREKFTVVAADIDSELFNHFLQTYREEIEKLVSIEILKQCQKALYQLRNNEIAGIIAGDRFGDILDIKLDFVFPRYRDYKLGEYFFVKHPELFRERGIKKIFAHARSEEYARYLERIGFRKVPDSTDTYEKVL
ncbi:hypothetical protein [Hydrogenimonas urashimensis]|uniref:hypothetical protein n=1 Tax=Hydrogenimonas urashimensis TaxID=2740515 RepID=UPI001F33DAFD|nr:hypothetical protein [Hydrogenimonas urashimensis]